MYLRSDNGPEFVCNATAIGHTRALVIARASSSSSSYSSSPHPKRITPFSTNQWSEKTRQVNLMQNWFGLSDPGMEEALYEVASMRKFSGLSLLEAIPDETTILNFRRLIEREELAPLILDAVNAHLARKGMMVKRGTMVDATIIAAPSSTKNSSGERAPEMHQTKKGNNWHFGMKAHIAPTPIRDWCIRSSRRPPTNPMSSRWISCFMAKRRLSMPTRDIPVPSSASGAGRSSGRSPAAAAR